LAQDGISLTQKELDALFSGRPDESTVDILCDGKLISCGFAGKSHENAAVTIITVFQQEPAYIKKDSTWNPFFPGAASIELAMKRSPQLTPNSVSYKITVLFGRLTQR
jgi:hypothetical protein